MNALDILSQGRKLNRSEVEIRLGAVGPSGNFTPGVRKEQFERILAAMQAYTDWQKTSSSFIVDSFTSSGERVRNLEPGCSETVQKKVLEQTVFPVLDSMVRLSVADETPATLPNVVPVVHARCKKRSSFFTNSGFRYDLSITSCADTVSGAVSNMDKAVSLVYEIEVEVDNRTLFQERTDRDLLHSLLIKVTDLLRV